MQFIFSINYFVWLIISALFFAAGEFLSKKIALHPQWSLVAWVLLAYLLGSSNLAAGNLTKKSIINCRSVVVGA
jgi:hypothetical protein